MRSAYLRIPLGKEKFVKKFVTKKVQEWSEQLLELANIATTQPHATFTAFGHGYVHNSIVKILAELLLDSCKNVARILARLLQDLRQEYLIIMQDPFKILARFFQHPCKILQKLTEILA